VRTLRRHGNPDAPPVPAIEIPIDILNEQIVIAAACSDPGARADLAGRLPSDSFAGKGHPEAWSAVIECHRRGLECDPATVQQLAGGRVLASYLSELIRAHGRAPNLAHHLAALDWDCARRTAAQGPLSGLLGALRDPLTAPERVRALARQLAESLSHIGGARRYLEDPRVLAAEQTVAIRKRVVEKACYPYGVDGLDKDGDNWRLIPGAAPGQITVITGVPGSGKSTVTARIVLGLAAQGRRVLVGAWEMGSGVTVELLAAMRLGIGRARLVTGELTGEEVDALEVEMERVGDFVTFVQMPFGRVRGEKQSNDRNLDIVHGFIADSGCDVAVFDLWKRCLRYTDPDDEEQALVRQQAIAQETGCHCILVQQQRAKDVEARPDNRPTREGIKGSGAWIEIPDTILGVYRPALHKAVPDTTIEIDVLKQRFGKWPIAIQFDWNGDLGDLSGGHTVVYDAPGASGGTGELNDFLGRESAQRRRKN
jgi:archaellum biogenesis ATPase FlaH